MLEVVVDMVITVGVTVVVLEAEGILNEIIKSKCEQ